MSDHVILLSVPGLRGEDLSRMPNLRRLTEGGDSAPLVPSFPAVTWPVQANMLTGELPSAHGVVANGFYWREEDHVEMWTASNDKILRPQIWDILHEQDRGIRSAAWFPMLSKGSGADFICMPAPVHNPDGSESLWCYTRPESLYGELVEQLGHFPLQHFWGPIAGIQSSDWIIDSAVIAAERWQPEFFYIYLPHLDYAAQKFGPDSDQAYAACRELDASLQRLIEGCQAAYGDPDLLWLVASEYTIVPVSHVAYPNRALRQAGLLSVRTEPDGTEELDRRGSRAWALVDHQMAHVFVRDAQDVEPTARLFRESSSEGIAEVLVGRDRDKYALDHPRSGEVVLVSEPRSWQAYYWWLDDARAPGYARTVDIHRKPGYDPVELFWDPSTNGVPLDAKRVRGSHGAPARLPAQRGVLLASQRGVYVERPLADTDVCDIVLRQFGI